MLYSLIYCIEKMFRAYAQNPSDMFRQSSEGAEDNAQISSFSAYIATFDVCHGSNEGG